jgi:hypothetical protein
MMRLFSDEFLTKLNSFDSFPRKNQIELSKIVIENICNINNFVGENGQPLTHYFDFLYKKPNQNPQLFDPIIEIMIDSNFFQVIKKILQNTSKSRLLDSDNPAREVFIALNKIIISYADFSIEFRKQSVSSKLIHVIVEIIKDEYNKVTNANDKCIECINFVIRALYNVTRLNEMRNLFRQLQIPLILISRISAIVDEKTRVCAILCLGWTLTSDDFETRSFEGLNLDKSLYLDVELTLSFSLLDRALQTGNNNSENMFRCFLGQHNLLPCFWAYEICDGIAKLGEIDSLRRIISNRVELFKLLVEFYTKSQSIWEKISASYAILVFSRETNFIEIIRKNSSFRQLLLTDIQHRELSNNLVLINHNLYFKIGIELELNLKSASEFELKFKELSTILTDLITAYAENEVSYYYKTCQKTFLQEIFQVLEENGDSESSKITKIVKVATKVKQNFDKKNLKSYIGVYPENSKKIKLKSYRDESAQGYLEQEINLKQSIILLFILLEKALLEGNRNQRNIFMCSNFSAYEISKKLGEWAGKESISEFILIKLLEKLELFVNLYNESHEMSEKISACHVINLFSKNAKFLRILSGNKKFCSSLLKDLMSWNGSCRILNDYLIEINYNLFNYTHVLSLVDQPDFKEINTFNMKINSLVSILKNIETKCLERSPDWNLEKIDQLIEEVKTKNFVILNEKTDLNIFQIEATLLVIALVRIKQYLNDLTKLKNQIPLPLNIFNYFNDDYNERYLEKVFPIPDDYNLVFKYFETTSEGRNCFLTTLIELLDGNNKNDLASIQ